MAKKGKYANTPKTGSKSVKSYDPKTTWGTGGGGSAPKMSRQYKPAGKDTPSFPGGKKKM